MTAAAGARSFTLNDVLGAAFSEHQRGNLDAAEPLYRQVLDTAPDNPDALHLLGVIRHQRGDHRGAIELIGRAIAVNGANASFHANLAVALQRLGRTDEALASYRRAVELDPTHPDANGNLGHLLKDQGEADEAVRRYETSIRYQPNVRAVHKQLATLYLNYRRFDEAAELFEKFLGASPDDAEARSNYGYALEALERFAEAEAQYRRAHELAPDSAEICSNVGNVLKRLERYEEAGRYLEKACALAPGNPKILRNRAAVLLAAEDYLAATPIFRQLIELEPAVGAYHHDLGTCLGRTGRADEAIACYAKAAELEPKDVGHLANLGAALVARNRFQEASSVYKQAIELDPDAIVVQANYCMALKQAGRLDESALYSHLTRMHRGFEPRMVPAVVSPFRATCDFEALESLGDLVAVCETGVEAANLLGTFLDLRPLTEDEATDRRVTALHRKWGDAIMAEAAKTPLPPRDGAKRSGKVRIGLLSSDLRGHAVAKFLMPIFAHLDRSRFELHCYTPWDLPGDMVQGELRRKSDGFEIIAQQSDREVAGLVRRQGIDILFDLNGATQNSRLEVLAWRPAPVQVSWLGYGATTGISAVDYALMDRYTCPEDPSDWAEAPLLMHGSWVCFTDYPDEPIPDALPLERNGAVTFGTLNAIYKFTPRIVALWARILAAVPGSRMVFGRPELASVIAKTNIVKAFAAHGIASDRLYFVANESGQFQHLAIYNEIDIALDTYPAVGGTTSCDTMWMGVPVIGRFGPNMHQRLNHALVHHCGLGEFSVETSEEYFAKAVALAGDAARLRELRFGLRDAVRASALYDAPGFAEDFADRMAELVAKHGLR
jgi:predicted O-linked N-acetylglucosamine transferase (SPINDLY family)